MAEFPTAVTTNGDPTSGNFLSSPAHSQEHQSHNAEIKATQTKIGTGASTPTANTLFKATGTGTSAWGTLTSANLASIVTDETGSGLLVFATSPTIATPAISNPTVTGGGSWAGSPTITTPTIASFTNATHDHSNSAGGGVLTYTGLPVGVCVQQVTSLATAVATGTTAIPEDDTIPQNTEGDQYLTASITPKSVTHTLIIEATLILASDAARQMAAALFQDTTANALALGVAYSSVANGMVCVTVRHSMAAGTTSSTAFKIRAGAAAGTTTFNGYGTARKYGAITKSSIVITEYKA